MSLLFFFRILLIWFLLLVNPVGVNSAEILQINSPKKILIGDLNRNLEINLFCVEVNKENELMAINILKKNFPRGTKVKIKPFGINGNNLLAKVYKLNENIEMSELLISNNLSNEICEK